MGQVPTVTFFVHGANQASKSEEKNRNTWEQAFRVDDTAIKHFLPVIQGDNNSKIQNYHQSKHPQTVFPEFTDVAFAWYGGIWQEIERIPDRDRFSSRLNPSSDENEDDRGDLLQRIERGVMKKHFDELVPFYELAVLQSSGKTLYEEICNKYLDDLIAATDGGNLHYVLIAHSMGCAVSYNVMTHISRARAGDNYVPCEGALSQEYRNKVEAFAPNSNCFGLMTFGNYTAYNWAQNMNHKLLFDQDGTYFVYPDAIGRWYNYWTTLGGDPYIIDDMLSNSMLDDDDDRFDDVIVFRPPFFNIGHGRAKWFRRNQFAKKLARKMEKHLYL